MRRRSVKLDRINEEVYRTLSDIIRSEVKDPRISPITSITGVEVTNDLKQAKVYVSVFGENDALDETMEGLKSSSGFIRGRLAKELNLRNTPELKFLPDASIAYGLKMSKMIDEVVARDERDHVPEDEEQ
ncbi:MAG: 30S ribosome-binding factor RbfA [Lachnospiraceae bacterium]|nr:30S ribosome-binding factor RbfA [Lachnospiraceae bacterium]